VIGAAAGLLIVPAALQDFAMLLAGHADSYGIHVTLALSVIGALAVLAALPADRSPTPSARGPALVGAVAAVASGVVVAVSSWLPWVGLNVEVSLWNLRTNSIGGYNGADRQSLAPFIVRAFRETDDVLFEGAVVVFGGLLIVVAGLLVLIERRRHVWSPRLVAVILELWVLAACFTLAVTVNNRTAIGHFNLRTGADVALAASVAGLVGVLLAVLPWTSSAQRDVASVPADVSAAR
jgi:hypothetical protein